MKNLLCVVLCCMVAVLPGCATLNESLDMSTEQAIALVSILIQFAPSAIDAAMELYNRLNESEKPKDRLATIERVLELYDKYKHLIPVKQSDTAASLATSLT